MSTKRKRPEDPAEHAPNHSATTRRTTRHTNHQPPIHPPPITTVPVPLPPNYTKLQTAFNPPAPIDRGRSSNQPSRQPQLPPPPRVLQWAPPEVPGPTKPAPAAAMGSIATKYNSRPSDLVAPEITYHVPQNTYPAQRTSSLVRPHGPSVQPPSRLDRGPPPIVTPVYPPKPPPPPERPPARADRNIDKVVFGDICFRTWYPSYYGKEVLGDHGGTTRAGSKDAGGKDTGGKSSSKKEREHQTMLERLYVCPHCFKYSKELVPWWGHVRVCEQLRYVPGRKIYIHPRGRRKILVPAETRGAGPKKRRGDSGIRYVEEVVQDEGEWSIWEVDGEKDGVSPIPEHQQVPKPKANKRYVALLPKPLLVREAFPRQQIRLLRCHRVQLLSTHLHAADERPDRDGGDKAPHGSNHRFLLEREDVMG